MESPIDPLKNTMSLPPVATAPPPPTSTASQVVLIPCAACKILRRKCAEKCILAPYFPPTEPLKFAIAHRVFGAANIMKFLQEIPETWRADAVNSMVYEANARLRDPVYGCAGAVARLQDQVNELQVQLAVAQAEIINVQSQNTNLFSSLCVGDHQSTQEHPQLMTELHVEEADHDFLDANFMNSEWGSF
ncbi:hypothetical protein MLD38_002589 [Melastoma candidum]|uniref:Uncharacterized protein n=1 Tax=Melastoma candidum TaxID=119954 RepID=A0ACB9RZU1_9MYRT|nr:hypothetical protein MLD38_002589 [Melastoma candidum]